jgi:glycosyltransferase involved in cell wall biosynthesis
MKYKHIPKDKRKKILLLSDDLRTHSGIATISREFVIGTSHLYNWVQLAGLINHPDKGKIFDLSDATNKMRTNTEFPLDTSIKLYPCDGYGNPEILRQIMALEKPDAILHFTDPRFWLWLYEMENEIREFIPITYLNIWDDVPHPMWNRPFYKSCDSLFAISKQTENINKFVVGDHVTISDLETGKPFNHLIHYVPHGVNEKVFCPIDKSNEEEYAKLVLFKKELFKDKKYEFVLFFNSRNIHRKHPSDIIVAFKHFCDTIGKENAKKCVLLLHTHPVDESGTDLVAVKNALCPDYDVVFSSQRLDADKMNLLYNTADVTINISSNEGFGISGAESMMSGTPLILNVTGGLQDQMGFTNDDGTPVEFTANWGSNHDATKLKHGKWVYGIFPSNRSIQGSIATPYIFDDRASIEEVAEAIYYWYAAGTETREKAGQLGRDYCLTNGFSADAMSDTLMDGLEATFKYWKPKNKFDLYKTEAPPTISAGFKIKEIDKSKIESKLVENWK